MPWVAWWWRGGSMVENERGGGAKGPVGRTLRCDDVQEACREAPSRGYPTFRAAKEPDGSSRHLRGPARYEVDVGAY